MVVFPLSLFEYGPFIFIRLCEIIKSDTVAG